METGHETGLIQAIQAFRMVYDTEHQHLPELEREEGWTSYWNSISARAIKQQTATCKSKSPKRPASKAAFGMEPAPKRTGLVGDPMRCSAPPD
jgi:hypothetical protein